MSDDELRPCPFCGGTRLTVEVFEYGAERVVCESCGACGPDDKSDWEARAGWNMSSRRRFNIRLADGREVEPTFVWLGDPVFRHEAAWLRLLRELGGGYGVGFEHGTDPEQLADQALELARRTR